MTQKETLCSQIKSLEKMIADLPSGKLLCIRNGAYVKWFQSDDTTRTYIPKQNRSLAQLLALRNYYSAQADELKLHLELIEKYLSEYSGRAKDPACELLQADGYRELLTPYLHSHPDPVTQWLDSDYISNTSHPENLIHNTLSGHNVRSKSEVIISNMLYKNKIPYIYERGLCLDDNVFFPDFTICHPRTFQIFYWEHFGMMDNQAYCEHTCNKLKTYSFHNIIPTINLITTYETRRHPVDSAQIERLIYEYFA